MLCLRPGLVRGRCVLGQPFFISEKASRVTVDLDFGRLVPAFLRLLMLPTSEFFFFVAFFAGFFFAVVFFAVFFFAVVFFFGAMASSLSSIVPAQASTLRNAAIAPRMLTMPAMSSMCAPNTALKLRRSSAGSSSMPYITA